jgi:hypothetical protein
MLHLQFLILPGKPCCRTLNQPLNGFNDSAETKPVGARTHGIPVGEFFQNEMLPGKLQRDFSKKLREFYTWILKTAFKRSVGIFPPPFECDLQY